MDQKAIVWIVLLFSGISYWLYLNSSLEINYSVHPHLIDQATGVKRKPSDFIDFKKIINRTTEYIESTDAQQRLYDLEYQSNFENPILSEQIYTNEQDLILSGQPVANQQLCVQQLDWILDQLNKHQNFTFLKGQLGYELTNYMDSFGKPQSGLYGGLISPIGSYRQCLRSSLNKGIIKTRYCVGGMRPKWWPTNETSHRRTTIRLGICLPETCDTRSFNIHKSLIETLAKWELPELYKNGWHFESMFCLPDERSPIRAIPLSGKIFLLILFGWCSLVIIGSIIHEFYYRGKKQTATKEESNKLHVILAPGKADDQEPQSGNKPRGTDTISFSERVFEALSLRKSLVAFKTNNFRIDYAKGQRVRVNLSGFDFFKVFMSIVIVLGHCIYLGGIFIRSLSNRIEMAATLESKLAMSLARDIDTFFLFFGLLTTYTLMRKFNVNHLANPLIWVTVNLGIIFRIGPVFVLIYWFSRSVSPYLFSGPWWDYGVDEHSLKGLCQREEWWKSIPHLGNLGRMPTLACLPTGWFIVCYAQLSLLLPLITYLTCKLPNHFARFTLISFLSIVSALNIGVRLYQQTSIRVEGFTIYGKLLMSLMEKFESTGYVTTLGRLGATSTGCLVGYLLRRYEEGHISKWPRWLTNGWTILGATAAMLLILFLPAVGHYNYLSTGRVASLEEVVGANMLLQVAWPLLNGMVIIPAATIYNHKAIVRFFAHSFWSSFNKLGLSIYLLHWEIIIIGFTSFEQGPSYGFVADALKMWSFALVFSIIIAFLIHLFIEVPLAKLFAMLTAQSTGGVKRKEEQQYKLDEISS